MKLFTVSRIVLAFLLPTTFIFLCFASMVKEAKHQRLDDVEIVEPPLPNVLAVVPEPIVLIDQPQTPLEKFVQEHPLPAYEYSRLEELYSQYETPGEALTDKEKLKSFGAYLKELASTIETSSIAYHGFLSDSEGKEAEFLRGMASLMN